MNEKLILESLFLSECDNKSFNTFGDYFKSFSENFKEFDSSVLNEGFDLSGLKFKKLLDFGKKSEKVKRDFCNNNGIDLDALIKKHTMGVNRLSNLIKEEKFDKQGIINISKALNKEIEIVQKNIITEVTDIMADTLKDGIGDVLGDNVFSDTVSYISIVVIISVVNGLFMGLFTTLTGGNLLTGQMIAAIFIAPVTEEIGKLVGLKISDGKNGMLYNVVFNVMEFTQYYKMLKGMGIKDLSLILKIRVPAIIMHTLNQLILMFNYKKAKESKDKNVAENAGSSGVFITACIHSLFNSFLAKIIVGALVGDKIKL